MTDMDIEKEIVAKGKTAARVPRNALKPLSQASFTLPARMDIAAPRYG